MFILHLAIGGCLKAPPVDYGITADTGGHIAYVIGAAAAQAEAGARVLILTRAVEATFLPEVYSRTSERFGHGVEIVRLQTVNRQYMEKEHLEAELLDLTFAFVSYLHTLSRLPDVIHAHFADAAEIAFVARDAFGIPVVYTPHALGRTSGSVSIRGVSLPSRVSRERRALEEADAVIVSSRDEATIQVGAHLTSSAEPNLHRIPPGVPDHVLVPASGGETSVRLSELVAEPGKPIVLAIARPVRKKNLAGLVRAFRDTGELRREANLLILAGRSQETFRGEQAAVLSELRDLIGRCGLRDQVAMPVDHTVADVAALYGRAAQDGVFVNVAFHEPFGLTLLEAAARGVPVVATEAGGARDIVEDLGHGLLVDPQDEAAIAAACLTLLTDAPLRAALAASGLRNVVRYDWSRYAQRSMELFADLLSRSAEAGAERRFRASGRLDPAEARRVPRPEHAAVSVVGRAGMGDRA